MEKTPKEKAEELYNKYMDLEPEYDWEINGINKSLAKQCALISVDEALNVFIQLHTKLVLAGVIQGKIEDTETYKFWQEVKQEINQL